MFNPNSFETELRDQTVTVEIGQCVAPYAGSDVEPPEEGDFEFDVYGDNGKLDLYWDEEVTVHAMVVEHLKYAAEAI